MRLTNKPKKWILYISSILFVLLLTIIFFRYTSTGLRADGSPIPPSGYMNETSLQIAFVLGGLNLIDYKDYPSSNTVEEHRDIVYKTIDSIDLKIDIYNKVGHTGDAPLIIFIHGGSWSGGDKRDYKLYTIPFAQKGYITASVQYRLSNVAKFPAQLLDVNDAIKFLKKNAADYHIDASKIILVGGSAGGHLVLLSAYSNLDQFNKNGADGITAEVQGVVDIYGPTDFTLEGLRLHSSISKLMGKVYDEAPEAYEKASPIHYVSKNVPPTLIFHGTLDNLVPVSQSDTLNSKLEAAGVAVSYHRIDGWPHAMDVSVEINDYLKYYMEDFFKKYAPKNQ
ncbi:MAG: alpha/beta hydrolase [Flavobacteriaceae bacterium]|nr:alpha/beta hydrolase [Flavobacteriaceae bacterium]